MQQPFGFVFVIHSFPDPEELLAIILFRKHGRDLLDTPFQYLHADNWSVEFFDPKKNYDKDGEEFNIVYVLLGVGGGMFDEHAYGEKPAKGKPCVRLVSDFLFGKKVPPSAAPFIDRFADQDSGEKHTCDSFKAITIAKLRRVAPLSKKEMTKVYEILDLAKELYDDRVEQILESVKKDAGQVMNTGTFQIDGTDYTVSMVETDNTVSNIKKTADITIIKRKKQGEGYWAILKGNHSTIPFKKVVRAVRVAEALANKSKVPYSTMRSTDLPGAIKDIPEWFYYEETDGLFNGNRKHPHVPKSKLNPEQIFKAVCRNATSAVEVEVPKEPKIENELEAVH